MNFHVLLCFAAHHYFQHLRIKLYDVLVGDSNCPKMELNRKELIQMYKQFLWKLEIASKTPLEILKGNSIRHTLKQNKTISINSIEVHSNITIFVIRNATSTMVQSIFLQFEFNYSTGSKLLVCSSNHDLQHA